MMKKRIILSTIYYLLSTLVYAASVEAKVDTDEAVKGNVVKLYLKAVGEEITFPQIDEIGGEPVVGTSMQSSSNITYVNGDLKSEKQNTKIIGFIPPKDMTIPSYRVVVDGKAYQTDPIDIKVVASKAPKLKKDAWYSFELSSEKNRVTVGESFTVTIFVSISDKVQGAKLAELKEPEMEGFLSSSLGEPKQYRQNSSTVVEQQYLLTAKKEGNFTIGAATAKLGEADTRRRDFWGRYATQWHDIASNELQIEVLPQMHKSDLVGQFSIDTTIDTTEVKANKPVNLSITIRGEGSLEDFEFQKYEIGGVTVFSDDAKVNTKVVNGKLQSTFGKSFAMISDTDFTIPSRSITVYNPQTKTLETLEIPSYQIHVQEDKNALTATTESSNQPPVEATESQLSEPHAVQPPCEDVFAWRVAVGAFGAGMTAMYLLMLLLRIFPKREKLYQNDEALQILYPHINESSEIEEMVRKLYARKNGDKSIEIDKKALKKLIEKLKK
jgi:hypothetical protein